MASVKSILKKYLTFSHTALQPWKCEEAQKKMVKNGFFKKRKKGGSNAWSETEKSDNLAFCYELL